MIRRVINIAIFILLPVMVLALLGFAVGSNKKQPCSFLSVSVINANESKFIDAENLKNEIIRNLPSIEGHSVRGELLAQIKTMVDQNPYIKESMVYRTIDGNVKVEVTQRTPLFRVFTARNNGYYIDVDGRAMPLSNNYASRVIIAGGDIHSGYSAELSLNEVNNSNSSTSNEKLLADLFKLVNYISQNTFWNAFIDYIHVIPGNKFELTPKNGAHTIELGTIDRMEQKFEKLETFYLNGLSSVGWDTYRKINLQYKNQVVCSK